MLILLVTLLVYLPGLSGPLIFDDRTNLQPLFDWLRGDASAWQVITGNGSGPLGRPVSMASFVLNAILTGDSVVGLKAGNLLLHLVNGSLVGILVFRLAAHEPRFLKHRSTVALLIAAIWLLHPLHSSTVLYVIQRMAMLSTLFSLLAVIAYIHGRELLDRHRTAAAWLWLAGLVPAFTMLATLSKENGLLALAMCAIVELTYFQPAADTRRPMALRAAMWLCAIVGAIATGWLLSHPEFVLDGYRNRDFSLTGRLLTEARILVDYLRSILLPAAPRMGIFGDAYPISAGLFAPASTFLAMLGWLTLTLLAWLVRQRLPALTFGVAWFLVGHAMESSIFALVPYFEHRNYLPMFGILWAVAGVIRFAQEKFDSASGPRTSTTPRGPVLVVLSAVVGVLAFSTHGRARVWQDETSLLSQSLRYHSDSRWLRMEVANAAMNSSPPNQTLALSMYAGMRTAEVDSTRRLGAMGQLALHCHTQSTAPEELLEAVFDKPGLPVESDMLTAFESLGEIALRKPCIGLESGAFAAKLQYFLDHAKAPEGWQFMVRLRYLVARLYRHAGNTGLARAAIARSWESTDDPGVGFFAAQLALEADHPASAMEILAPLLADKRLTKAQKEQVLSLQSQAAAVTTKTGSMR
ncbi:MAG: hypothetical protein R3F01_03405 [Lysobacteraceae bacterium]